MKTLYNYINESVSAELKQQILTIIDNSNFTDKQAKKMIRSVSDPKIVVDLLYEYFSQRGCEDDAKNLARIIDANDNLDEFLSIVSNPSILPTANDFVKENNLYKLFSSLNLNKDTIIELASEKPSRNSITRGAFEILCELLLQDTNLKNANYSGKAGDVNAGGLALEFKGPGARVKSQVEHSAVAIDDKFNEICKVKNPDFKDGKAIFASQQNMKQYIPTDWSDDEIFSLIAQSLLAQYNLEDSAEDLKSLQKDIVNKGNINYQNITRLMGCIQLKGYVEDEHWDYMVIFKGKSGDQAINKGDYFCLSADDAENIPATFNNKLLHFGAGGHGYRSVRDHYCQISCY